MRGSRASRRRRCVWRWICGRIRTSLVLALTLVSVQRRRHVAVHATTMGGAIVQASLAKADEEKCGSSITHCLPFQGGGCAIHNVVGCSHRIGDVDLNA
jgi:hypothetical protein